jgi:3',5'-cyclic AMP phosphodiesterase CpdA
MDERSPPSSRSSRLRGPRGRSVTWMHVSDLHFSKDDSFERSVILRSLVRGARDMGERGIKPDLVFVTGDIANGGKAEEYARAARFFEELLGSLGLDRSRLFIVPGNHDVDRGRGQFLKRTLSSEDESDAFFSVAESHAHLAKLQAFRTFHDELFRGIRVATLPGSVAVPEVVVIGGVRVGILPINSATFAFDEHDFGQLWVGRAWLETAIEKLEELSPDLRIALVHHPLDWLHDDERGNVRAKLYGAVDVLLRGHLHDTEAEVAMSQSGGVLHLAAGASYQARRWPKRALFATAELGRGKVRVTPVRYEDKPYQVWTVDPSVFPRSLDYSGEFEIGLKQPSGDEDDVTLVGLRSELDSQLLSRATSHERIFSVWRDGLTEARIAIDGLYVQGDAVLSLPSFPFCDIAGDRTASSSRGPIDVHQTELRDGRKMYWLVGYGGTIEHLTWSYRLSNAVALTRTDVDLMRPAMRGYQDGWRSEGYDGRPHVVRFGSELLTIVHRFEDDPDAIEDARVVVERRREGRGQERWEIVPLEMKRCELTWTPSSATLRIASPVVGYRYTLAYRPKKDGLRPGADARAVTQEVRRRCRGAPAWEQGFAQSLTERIEEELTPVLGGALGPEGSWVGLLWHDELRQLMTSFGRFANRTWSARFKYGSGIAGHALRFCRCAAWARGSTRRVSLLYQPTTDVGGLYTHDYDWIVCVPIVVGPQGPAVGVVSFAGPEARTEAEHRLRDLAALAVDHGGEVRGESAGELMSSLFTVVNGAFWTTVAEEPTLPSRHRELARATLVALGVDG